MENEINTNPTWTLLQSGLDKREVMAIILMNSLVHKGFMNPGGTADIAVNMVDALLERLER